jgi:hypothetical protein
MLENVSYLFYKTSYPNEEVNHTEPSPSVSVPYLDDNNGLPLQLVFHAQDDNNDISLQLVFPA